MIKGGIKKKVLYEGRYSIYPCTLNMTFPKKITRALEEYHHNTCTRELKISSYATIVNIVCFPLLLKYDDNQFRD